MVGTICPATSGFSGVTGYCCRGGGGGEEKKQDRAEPEVQSITTRPQEPQSDVPVRYTPPGHDEEEEERKKRQAERSSVSETPAAEAYPGRRLLWAETRNLATNDPLRGARIMEATARDAPELKRLSGGKATGRKLKKPVLHYSLSWAKDERPDRTEMTRAATGSLKALGLEDRQAVIVAHGDREHPHVHVIVNRVSPDNGKAAGLSKSKLKLSKWAEGYEREQGRIRCHRRVRNNARRDRGEYVRAPKRMPRSRWEREHHGPARFVRRRHPQDRSDWGREVFEVVEHRRWQEAQHERRQRIGALSTRCRQDWSALYERHRAERTAEGAAHRTIGGRWRRWRERGSRLGELRRTLVRGSDLWRRWENQMERRHKTERGRLGLQHSREAKEIEAEVAQAYRAGTAGGTEKHAREYWKIKEEEKTPEERAAEEKKRAEFIRELVQEAEAQRKGPQGRTADVQVRWEEDPRHYGRSLARYEVTTYQYGRRVGSEIHDDYRSAHQQGVEYARTGRRSGRPGPTERERIRERFRSRGSGPSR